MESVDNKEELKKTDEIVRQEIYSMVIRAGKRTYFFDVKSTRNDEYYLTITESKKKFSDKGQFHYEKHKVFLYQEDFEKFTDSLEEVIRYIHDNQPEIQQYSTEKEEIAVEKEESDKNFKDLEFDDI
jgi:hypothetical protein